MLLLVVLNGILVGLDHLLDHLTANRTGLTRGQIAVVTLSQIDTDLTCGLHLELFQCFLCLGNESLVACHNFISDVVLMGFNPHLGLLEHPNASMRQAALAVLEEVGLAGREQDNYMTLSEGQKQLCILARTLVSGGKLLLLDEPESALDFRHRYRMLAMLRSWAAKGQQSALVALHDPALALECCDQLLLLDERKVLRILRPAEDDLSEMEMTLSRIYGKISLVKCPDRTGREHLVMLKEQEETR